MGHDEKGRVTRALGAVVVTGRDGIDAAGTEADRTERLLDFLSTVSHEIRTPLTAIGGIGMTLERRWDNIGEDIRRELVSRLNANARVLDEIVSTLLDFSRVEAGTLHVRPQPVDVLVSLTELTDRLRSLFNDHEVCVEAAEGVIVEADRLLLDRVIENLLVNAVRHTRVGTRIWLQARPEGDEVVIHVRDNGDGIPDHELARLGERFFRGGDPGSRAARGTGLGLALVVEILRLHGTELDIESEVGRGSCFSFRLRATVSPGAPYEPVPAHSRAG